jgi:thiamine-monophosphate kinase
VRLADLGEFELIARLTQGLDVRPDVVLGVGDDAALLDLRPDALLVATCDAQVEDRHFLRGVATPEDIGHKALAVNLSDIAAMGAEPLWALVSLVVPPALPVAELDGLYSGLRALARRYGVAVVGGNVAATSGPLVVDVTVLGKVPRGAALTRSGGRPGDRLLVTGTLGAAAAGLLAVRDPAAVGGLPPAVLARVREALVRPEPRVAEGRALASTGDVTALLDISDGLAADLGHLCAASGTGAVVEAESLPVDDATRAVAAALGRDPLPLALGGGEDYQLLCAVRPEGVERVRTAVAQVGGSATPIGYLTDATEGMRLRHRDGTLEALAPVGWDHLRA